MVAGSVLIIYEGDELALEQALVDNQTRTASEETVPASAVTATTSITATSSSVTGDTTSTISQSSTNAGIKVPPAYAVKLIDFAHTKLQEGLGPDEGALFGLSTVIRLLEGRINEVQEALGE